MKLIPLSIWKKNGKYKNLLAKVDDEDYDFLMQWRWTVIKRKTVNTFYAIRTIKGVAHFRMHRVIMGATNPSIQIDHIDGDGLNNQRSNLRFATQLQNNMNRRKQAKKSHSKYKGVVFRDMNKYKKWCAIIRLSGVVYRKSFVLEEDAATWYDNKAKELFKEFANLNFK